MPQPGVHAVLALAVRKPFLKRRWFALGLVFGAMLPDADGYAQAYGVLVQGLAGHTAEAIYHRTLTHSFFFAAALLGIFWLVSVLRRDQRWFTFGLGLSTGVAFLHILPDIFIWFDGVELLWPLGGVDLWAGFTMPDRLSQLLQAGNYWAFLWYFTYLGSLARKAKTDTEYLSHLRRWMYLQGSLAVILTVLTFVLPPTSFNTPSGALFLLVAFPNVLWVTWRMRETIER
jgi:membrane-bound metal-dependent hydrolase YbcI (DUF457 family)